MSITHYRLLPRADFFDTLGLRGWGFERLPASPVHTADVILRDADGIELGRFEIRYDIDGDGHPAHHLLPCAPPEQLELTATLWL